jgi:two-component system chemotaxis response regulator CheB
MVALSPQRPALVVIGASQGGVEAVLRIVEALDADVPAIWCVVLHIDSHDSILPSLLTARGRLPAAHAEHGERLRAGRIYMAPPDRHLTVEDGLSILSRGPRENWTRPAVDPLFRTAASSWGARVVGVILTGHLDDGSAGLREVKRRGGLAVVQDPADAVAPGMPTSALRAVAADHRVPLAEMPALLCRLARHVAARSNPPVRQAETMVQGYSLERPYGITCPECGGVMRREDGQSPFGYRCHIGHRLTGDALLAAKARELDERFSGVLALLKEHAELCGELAEAARREGRDAGRLEAARTEALERAEAVRATLEGN